MMEPCEELTFEYLETLEIPIVRKKSNDKSWVEYLNIEAAFDIETTSTTNDDGKIAFMYIWQLGIGINNKIFYGRSWEDLMKTLSTIQSYFDLNSDKRLVIYVHNLAYEFQFFCKILEWEVTMDCVSDVFSVKERKPLKAISKLGIEFRDSLILSGYSLENTAKTLTIHKVKKMVGDLDYSLIRTPDTELTDKEMKYCENDILIILAYINEQIGQYEDITKIPMTNTGRVRRYVKENCFYGNSANTKNRNGKFGNYSKIMKHLNLTESQYMQLSEGFMGGFTHSNHNHTAKVMTNVDSIDFTSSYPAVMLSEQFPMNKGESINVRTISELEELSDQYCVIFDIRLKGIENKLKYESYLSESKCRKMKKSVINNGRVYSADQLETTITDVDFRVLKRVYKWDSISIGNVIGYKKGYLPKDIIESILELYETKTELKDVKGRESEYMLAKGMLNSVYGMCVTDFIKDDNLYNDSWLLDPVDRVEEIDKYNDDKYRFLYYPWGIWITAYARRNLWTGIIAIGEDYIYSDTDSIKMMNYEKHKPYIAKYDRNINNKLSDMMYRYGLDESRLAPKTIEGIPKPIGVWDYEGHYSKFKTLGAKRYLYEKNGEFNLTVAGLSKTNGMDYIKEVCDNDSDKIFDFFSDGMYIPADRTGKMTHTYIDEEKTSMITDYQGNVSEIVVKSSVHLEKCDFTLTVSDGFNKFLNKFSDGYSDKGDKIA